MQERTVGHGGRNHQWAASSHYRSCQCKASSQLSSSSGTVQLRREASTCAWSNGKWLSAIAGSSEGFMQGTWPQAADSKVWRPDPRPTKCFSTRPACLFSKEARTSGQLYRQRECLLASQPPVSVHLPAHQGPVRLQWPTATGGRRWAWGDYRGQPAGSRSDWYPSTKW